MIEARERGEVVASLRASDARIYERFGYSVASSSARLEVEREAAKLRPDGARGGDVRLVDPDQAWPLLAETYARQPAGRAGAIARPSYWWRLQQLRRQGAAEPEYVAVSGAPGQEAGFVRYHPIGIENWFSGARRTVVVDDFVAEGLDAYGALIGHLLSVDLVDVIVFASRPIDDPLPELIEDRRAVRVAEIRDETWLRLLDVRAALAARSYAGRSEVVLEIVDPLMPENSGRFRIFPEGVTQTGAPANARADVSALAAAYLGGTRWWQLQQAGRVSERDAGAIAALDGLFAAANLPHAGTVF